MKEGRLGSEEDRLSLETLEGRSFFTSGDFTGVLLADKGLGAGFSTALAAGVLGWSWLSSSGAAVLDRLGVATGGLAA